MTATEALIAALQEQCEYEPRWSIRSDRLEEFYDSVELYRSLYQAEQISVDEYGPENAGELVALVERLTERDYREEFRDAGLYLTYDDRIELTGRFVRTIKDAVVVHTPEPETFRAMLRDFKRYDEAALIYQQTFFDIDKLATRCAHEYAEIRTFADTAAAQALVATVRAYLKLLVQRHVVELEALAPALFDILRIVALHEGVLRQGRRTEEARADDDQGAMFASSERDVALRVLGFSGKNPSKQELQSAYRSLMRRYHPDINPKGLETAKRINHAYGILVSAAQ
ncbi:MAG: DnaJ domain-containing protein [Spirochaetales bacterium]